MMFPGGETITVTREGAPTGATDAQGNPVLGVASTFSIDGVGVAPENADEATEPFGAVSSNGYTLYLPYGSDLRATDLVTVRGEAGWAVVGDVRVMDWRNPFTGTEFGTVAVVRRAS